MRLIARYITAALLAVTMVALGFGTGMLSARAQIGSPLAATCSLNGTTRTCSLTAASGQITVATGQPPVKVWSYQLSTGGGLTPLAAVGPTLVANTGEDLAINLTNTLDIPTSLEIPGLSLPADLIGVAKNAPAKTYTFKNLPAGTYLYEAGALTVGANGPRQVAMGMVGALIVRPSSAGLNPVYAGKAYDSASTAYTDEALLLYSEIDPDFNNIDPLNFRLEGFKPKYQLINGKTYTKGSDSATSTAVISAKSGGKLLLRQINASPRFQATSILGLRQTIIADDGSLLNAPLTIVAKTIGAGQTLDSIVQVPGGLADGTNFPLYNSALPGAGPSGLNSMGGMLTFISTAGAVTLPGDLDLIPPVVDTLSFPALSKNTATPALSATAHDNIGVTSASYTLSGGSIVTPTPKTFDIATGTNVSLAGLADGAYTITVTVADAAGNTGSKSASFTIDSTGPVINGVTVSSPSVSVGTAVTVSANISDPHGVTATYSLDGGPPQPLTAGVGINYSASISTSSLSVTSHSVVVSASDSLNNISTAPSISFNVTAVPTIYSNNFEPPVPTTSPFGWTSATFSNNRLQVLAAAALHGSTRGLQATLNNNNTSYVQQTITSQDKLHVSFYFNPNGATPAQNSAITIFNGFNNGNNGANPSFRVNFQRVVQQGNNVYQVRLEVARQGGTSQSAWYTVSGATKIDVIWQRAANNQASSNTNADLLLNGVLQAPQGGTHTLTNLANSSNNYAVNRLQLGIISGANNSSGSIYLDEFVATAQ